MRYYRIEISDPKTGKVISPPGFEGALGGATYTSYVNGQTLPEAWLVELDIPVIGAATPQGFGLVRVWGVSLQEIGQANDLTGKNVSVFGGMQKGLPLANLRQSGLLARGTIFQSFGYWEGNNQSLDLVIMPGSSSAANAGGIGTLKSPKNIVLNWPANTPLAGALASTLKTAFPDYKQSVNISANIVRPNAEVGFFPTLEQLAQYVLQTSLDVVKTPSYPGVTLVLANDTLTAFDGTAAATSSSAKRIAFEDLIGQPTWINAPNISFKTVMRADVTVGDDVQLPPVVTTNTQNATSSLINQRATFQGGFSIVSARHVGNSRQPSAEAWVTVYEGAPKTLVGAA